MTIKQRVPLSLGNVLLGEIPQIVVIVERVLQISEQQLLDKGVRLLELRADAFTSQAIPTLLRFATNARKKGFGLLGTIRQQVTRNQKQRLSLYHQLLPYVDAVDIEYEDCERGGLVQSAQTQEKLVLLSTHNFSMTPKIQEMESVIKEAQKLNANIVKLAYYIKNSQDLQRLIDFSLHCSFPWLVWIGMGPWGLISRILSLLLYSPFTYAFLEHPNAPGQLSVTELHNALMRYHPAYKVSHSAREQKIAK